MTYSIYIKRCIAGALLLLPFAAFPQRYDFRLDTSAIMLGDQTTLAIENPVPMPTPEQLYGTGIVALGQRLDTATGTLYTVITSFEPGEHWLHVGEDSVLLTVNDVEGVDTTANAEIKDITGILRQPYTFWEIFRWVLLFLLVAAAVVGAIYLVKRMKEKKPLFVAPPAPPVPPDVKALQALEDLRRQGLWQQGRTKEYHTELTDIVRRYLEEAHGINSTEMTTGQTLEVFNASPVCTDETFRLLRQMLETADMVKFAKSDPPAYEHDRSMDSAVEFVGKLKPVKEEPVEGEGGQA